MSEQKRKLDEFCDPDYQEFHDNKKRKLSPQKVLTETERHDKIRAIVKREFQNELVQKEQEINKIESRLLQAKKLLHRVRFGVVASFYSKKGLTLTDENSTITQPSSTVVSDENTAGPSTSQTSPNPTTNKQITLHPSLKKLIGKTPIDYEELLRFKPTPMRQAAKTAKSTISEKLIRKKKELKGNHTITENPDPVTTPPPEPAVQNIKIPRYIPPIQKDVKIPSLNSSRHRNQTRHLIAVGNTSKYIGDEKSKDGVTHKWLVYVKTKTELPIEAFVKKVRFFLHPSYKPNDVVEVQNPPFQLSRRGWGEFPLRIQLYFDVKAQQKPLQIYHNLVLDRKMTGLQTMGAETVVELFLNTETYLNETITSSGMHQTSDIMHNDPKPVSTKTSTSISSGDLFNELNLAFDNEFSEIVKDLPDLDENNLSIKMEPELHIIENDLLENIIEETIIEQEIRSPSPVKKEKEVVAPVITPPVVESLNTIKKNGQIYIVDPNKKPKSARPKNQVSLLKPNLSLLKSSVRNNLEKQLPPPVLYHQFILTDHDYAGNYCICPPPSILPQLLVQNYTAAKTKSVFPVKTNNTLTKKIVPTRKRELDYRKILETHFVKTKFATQYSAIVFLLKKIPLTTLLVKEQGYLESFPFTVESPVKFYELSKVKQCNYEWLRAKLISKWTKKKFGKADNEDTIWTTKEIMQFAKRHGYTPATIHRPTTNSTDNSTNSATNENNLKNIIENEIKKEKDESRRITLTQNHDIYKWMNESVEQQILAMGLDTAVINVEDDEARVDATATKNSKTVIKPKYEQQVSVQNGKSIKLWLPLSPGTDKDGDVVTEMCEDIGIRMESEEIIENVFYPAAKRILVQVYRSFVEDVVRSSYANRLASASTSTSFSSTSSSIASSSSAAASIQREDVCAAITSRPEYDILTNKYLGVSKLKQIEENR